MFYSCHIHPLIHSACRKFQIELNWNWIQIFVIQIFSFGLSFAWLFDFLLFLHVSLSGTFSIPAHSISCLLKLSIVSNACQWRNKFNVPTWNRFKYRLFQRCLSTMFIYLPIALKVHNPFGCTFFNDEDFFFIFIHSRSQHFLIFSSA